mmetsp:Transcript_14839/g.59444  ORF Transcript_14839/g.59444 Transcript_14839/m.59444 type:complete len:94 (-) Transcript_14839:1252-1533(-)
MYTFSESWDVWEVHPKGHEVVVCTAGSITLLQERPGGAVRKVALAAGEYAINPPGVWHSADVGATGCTCVFITAGLGTQHKPRDLSSSSSSAS